MIVYKKIAKGKNKQDKFNSNKDIVIVHYDIETHTRSGPDNMRVHVPYIIGFVYNDSDNGSFKLDKLVINNGAILKITTGNIKRQTFSFF